jgi:hypothetical protein
VAGGAGYARIMTSTMVNGSKNNREKKTYSNVLLVKTLTLFIMKRPQSGKTTAVSFLCVYVVVVVVVVFVVVVVVYFIVFIII